MNMLFTISSRNLTPSHLLPPLPSAPTLLSGHRCRPRENAIGDAGAAALAGAVVYLTALEKLNLM